MLQVKIVIYTGAGTNVIGIRYIKTRWKDLIWPVRDPDLKTDEEKKSTYLELLC